MAPLTLKLDESLKSSVTLIFFENVQNTKHLKERLLSGELEAALIKPDLVLDVFQILIAANKAVYCQKTDHMKTKSVFSEVLYNLSPTKNITESLKNFGIGNSDSEIIALLLNADEHKVINLTKMIEGTTASFDVLSQYTNASKVKDVYKVKDAELKCGSLLDTVITKMAVKDIVKKA